MTSVDATVYRWRQEQGVTRKIRGVSHGSENLQVLKTFWGANKVKTKHLSSTNKAGGGHPWAGREKAPKKAYRPGDRRGKKDGEKGKKPRSQCFHRDKKAEGGDGKIKTTPVDPVTPGKVMDSLKGWEVR